MILLLTIHSLLFTICYSVPFGKVNKTRFTSRDLLNSEAIWLSNQLTPEKCLCTILSQYNNTLLFNSYQNGSCQVFLSLPYTYTMEYRNDSTFILLSSLPSRDIAPCCSNLPWLIKRITNSSLSSISLNTPSYLVIDDYDELVIRLISHGKFEQQGAISLDGNDERRINVESFLYSIVYVYGNDKNT
ncbi:unnamed protein product [Adineta steineri]|uniref:Uncharacterized protein n=2 Tax=Adineta steineri TaxID=433720 RepID=A0A816GWY0_9BILA|nr:unnamed protein product [Adineta steineri]CAF1679398.1 unnamed protein product [Adineta steineri]